MLRAGDVAPVLANLSFAGNETTADGSALLVDNANFLQFSMSNLVAWGNPGVNQIQWYSLPPTLNNSIVEGGYSGPGQHILTVDPLFQDPDGADGVVGTVDDDLRLGAGSPAIDAGDDLAVPPDLPDLDQDGDRLEPLPVDVRWSTRFFDMGGSTSTVDMGAHEALPADSEIFLDGFESGDTSAWSNTVP